MSLAEIEKQVPGLSEEERQQFAEWFHQNQERIVPANRESREPDGMTEAMKAELLRRKQEQMDHPERFRQVRTREELKAYFEEIRDEKNGAGDASLTMVNGFEVISPGARIVTPELVQKLAEEADLC